VESNFLPPSARKLQPGHLLTGGDFNADGLADVTIATKTPSGTWMLLAGTSKGDGTFTWSSQSTSWGYFPAHIQTRDEHDTLTTGDFDGDGKSDVMLLRAFSGALASTPDEAYIGLAGKGATQGAGRFRLSQVASAPWLKKISTGDFNGDGKTDLLCEENQVWARGKGDGQFDPPATGVTAIPGCGAAAAPDVSVGAADLNGDGRSDILCSHNDIANDAYILSDRMTGAGALNDDAQRWMHADMTGDGVADLVFVEHLNPGYRISLVSTNHTTLIQARTNFDVLPTATVPGLDEADTNRFMAFDAGSPTGGPDGKADLILVDRKDATSLQVYTLFSNGDGTFTPKIDVATFGARDLQNWRPADLDGDGNGDLIHLFSLGPGPGVKVSYLRSRGDGTWDSGGHHYFQQTAPLSRPSIQDFLNMEVNGDGRSDLVYLEPGAGSAGSIRTLLGKGDGTFSEKVFLSSAGFFRDMRRVKVADLNGDGLSDLVHVTAAAGRSNLLKLSIDAHLSDGCGGWKHRLLEVDPTTPSPNAEDRDLLEDINLVRFMDVDGDGRSDLIHLSTYLPTGGSPASALIVARNLAGGSSSWASDLAKGLAFGNYGFDPWRWQGYIDPQTRDSGLLYVHPVQSQAFLFRSPPDHITRTSNGIGGATEVTYTSLIGGRTYLPEGSLPQVVTSVETRDEAYNPAVTDVSRYAYDEARYSPALGRILGFGSLRKSDQRSAELTKTIMDDRCGARPSEFQKMDPTTNAMFSLTKLDYLNPTATQAAPYVCEQNLREDYEAEGTSNQRLARREELILDAYGNIISRVEKADQAVTTKILRPFNAPSTTGARAYIVNKPTAAGTQEYDGVNWTAKSFSTFEYDGNGVNVGPGALGELRAINAYYDSSHSVRTTYEYYPSGQLWRTTDPAGQRSTVVYDSTYGLYPETICSLPPARVSFGSLCQTHVVDPVTGQIKSTTDPNQAVTKFSYDAHGRLTRTTRDDQSFTATTYLDAGMLTGPPTARQRIRVEISDGSSDNVRWSEAFFDGLGRTYHAVREGGATQDTRFVDASRLPEAISDLYNAGGTPSEWTRYGYDPVGRTVRTLASDNSDQKSVFGVGQTIGIDQLGVRKIAYTNGRGQVIRIEEPKGVTAATAAITNYKHDGLGRLVEILDHFGNATSINYDMLGRQISTKDPDRGLTKFAYFDNGLLRERVDAKKQTIRFQYDPLGRSSQREDVEADGTTVSRTVTWTWDRTAARATMGASLGRMVAMQDQQSNAQLTASYHYDKLGRIDEAQRCVDGTCVSMGSTYDLAGRLKSLIYPDSTGSVVGTGAETVDYTYDDAGRLSKVGTYFAAQSYNLYDQLTDVTYGNGISTAIKYDPKRLWIDRAEVMSPLGSGPGTPLPIPIYLATYRHDATGRIQELQWDFQPAPPRGRGPTQPTASAVNLKYQYDDLGRLIKVDSPDAAHREDYHYDEIGRMKYNSRVGDIHYGDSLHVHAPTTSDLPPGSHIRKYDILGDLSELQDPTKALKLGWTIDGRVAVIYNINPGTGATTRTSFAYDPAGARVKKVSPTGGSMYFGPLIERQGSRLITYYMAGDRLIARRDGAAVSYYTQDHAHSTRLETDAGGQVVNRYDYSAFGLPLARQEQVPQDLEFAGGRSDDETGLTFMNARYYDPELRHFVSADTIVPRPMNPQSLHRYSFAQQDPINFWDPSGHMRLSVELRKDSYQQARTAWAGYSSQCSLGTGAAALVCAVPTGSWGAVIASGSPVKVNAMGEVVKIRGGGVWINVPLPPWSIMQTRRPAPQNTGAPLSPPPLVTVEDAEIAAFLKRQKDALAMLEDFDLELSVWDLVEKGKEYVDRVKKWKEWFTDVRDVNDALKDPDPVRGFDILDKTTKHLPDWWPFKEIWRRGPDTVRTAPGGVEAHERQRETGTISVHGGRLEEAFRGERE
jgi:RHS repeat-associated protein